MTDPTRKKARPHPPARRAREGDLAALPGPTLAAIKKLGPPPTSNPAAIAAWQLALAGVIAWAFARGGIGPHQTARLRLMLAAIRIGRALAARAR